MSGVKGKGGMKGRSGGARPGAGRKRGLSKKTIERLEQKRIAEEASRAVTELEKARAAKKKLGKEVIEEFMFLFAGMAAFYQPPPPGQTNTNENEEKFKTYAVLAVDAASELAKYQSPTFKAIAISAPLPLPPPDPKTIEGKVIRLDDPVALGIAYRRMVTASAK